MKKIFVFIVMLLAVPATSFAYNIYDIKTDVAYQTCVSWHGTSYPLSIIECVYYNNKASPFLQAVIERTVPEVRRELVRCIEILGIDKCVENKKKALQLMKNATPGNWFIGKEAFERALRQIKRSID